MLDILLNYLSTKEYSQSNLQIVFFSGVKHLKIILVILFIN